VCLEGGVSREIRARGVEENVKRKKSRPDKRGTHQSGKVTNIIRRTCSHLAVGRNRPRILGLKAAGCISFLFDFLFGFFSQNATPRFLLEGGT